MPLLMRRPRPIGRSTVGELDRSPSGVARPWSGGGKGRCDDVVMSSGGSEWCARCEILDGLEVKVGGSDGEMRPLRRRPGSGDGEGGMTRSSDRPCSSSSSASSTDDAYVAGNVRECRYGWCSSRASWSRCSASPAVLSERNELRRAVLPRPSTPLGGKGCAAHLRRNMLNNTAIARGRRRIPRASRRRRLLGRHAALDGG